MRVSFQNAEPSHVPWEGSKNGNPPGREVCTQIGLGRGVEAGEPFDARGGNLADVAAFPAGTEVPDEEPNGPWADPAKEFHTTELFRLFECSPVPGTLV